MIKYKNKGIYERKAAMAQETRRMFSHLSVSTWVPCLCVYQITLELELQVAVGSPMDMLGVLNSGPLQKK